MGYEKALKAEQLISKEHALPLNRALAGKLYEAYEFPVEAEAIRRFARATNDYNPRFLSDRPVAPPAFAFVPVSRLFDVVFKDPDLGVDMAMLVHARQEHRFFTPLAGGDVLKVAARMDRVDLADTGHSFTLAIELTNQRLERVVEILSTMLIRKSGTGGKAPDEPVDRGETVLEQHSLVDQDQPARYAEASGDYNPIHLDRQAARRSGFPQVVLHGMCTMAMSCKVVLDGVAGGDPDRLAGVSVNFSRPVFPGQTLSTTVWRSAAAHEYGFETANPRGALVIRAGNARLAG
ncbi:MAG: MaoC/PaaZ C-terminal domain-containing protein [Actinomycetota bacterium]